MKKLFILLFLMLPSFVLAQMTWYDPLDGEIPQIHGRGWNIETGRNYHRFPDRAKGMVRDAVWSLSTNSTGLYVDFYCNAPEILVKYTVSGSLSWWNMPAIAYSGVDMYVTDNHGVTRWCACPASYSFGSQPGDTITFHYKDLEYQNYHNRGSEYQLFLPLLNEVTSLKIGIPADKELKFAPITAERPIVVYGTSIAQGIAASRPAMAWTNQVRRRTDSPVINLGFSGNALMDAPVFDLISEIDAQLFVLDCMPNMYPFADSIVCRTINGVSKIRKHSSAPILLVENDGYMYGATNRPIENECEVTNRELRKAYEQLLADNVKDIYYLTKAEIGITPDAQVDGWHPSDLGMSQYADAYVKKINEILHRTIDPLFAPCRQRREPDSYEWAERHEQILQRNAAIDPEVLMIGNSITHFWGGEPVGHRRSGVKAWQKLFGKRKVTNMGFGWDRIENVYWRIYHGELDNCSPMHICMMMGTNNLEKNSNEEIVEGLVGLARLIRERQPEARLHLIKIYPRRGQEERVSQLNALLESRMVKDDKIDFVDCSSSLTLDDGKIDETLFMDGLHPNEKGYERIAKVLKSAL